MEGLRRMEDKQPAYRQCHQWYGVLEFSRIFSVKSLDKAVGKAVSLGKNH